MILNKYDRMFSRRYFSSFIFLFSFICVGAQITENKPSELHNSLLFKIDNVNYFVNNEYFNDIQTGYTFPGTWVRPSLLWQINDDISVSGGLFLQKQFGTDTLAAKRMSISAVWNISNELIFSIGDYDAVNRYYLPTQLIDAETYFISPFDQGIILEWMPNRLKSSVWVSWERYINAGDPFREEIFGGASGEYTLLHKSVLSLTIPFGFTAYHKGGQIDASELDKQNIFNYYSGLKGSFGRFGLEASYFGFSNNVDKPETAYDKGKAMETAISYRPDRWSFRAAYWYADKFYSPVGKSIYQSVSSVSSDNNMAARRLLNGELDYKIAINEVAYFAFNTGLFYDIETTTLDYGLSFSLILSPSVALFK